MRLDIEISKLNKGKGLGFGSCSLGIVPLCVVSEILLFVLPFRIVLLRQEGHLISNYCNWAGKSGKPIYQDITFYYSVCESCCSVLC